MGVEKAATRCGKAASWVRQGKKDADVLGPPHPSERNAARRPLPPPGERQKREARGGAGTARSKKRGPDLQNRPRKSIGPNVKGGREARGKILLQWKKAN